MKTIGFIFCILSSVHSIFAQDSSFNQLKKYYTNKSTMITKTDTGVYGPVAITYHQQGDSVVARVSVNGKQVSIDERKQEVIIHSTGKVVVSPAMYIGKYEKFQLVFISITYSDQMGFSSQNRTSTFFILSDTLGKVYTNEASRTYLNHVDGEVKKVILNEKGVVIQDYTQGIIISNKDKTLIINREAFHLFMIENDGIREYIVSEEKEQKHSTFTKNKKKLDVKKIVILLCRRCNEETEHFLVEDSPIVQYRCTKCKE